MLQVAEYENFVRKRITQLRHHLHVSEHKMSLDLGKSGSYMRSISIGKAMPSMRYVFVDAMGNLIQPDSVTTGFPQLLKENGLRRIRFHDLRHSCASLLLKEGVPMKQIQEWLGHSDISTTANIYAHLDSQSKNLSARTMANTLTLPEAQPIKK